jgi:hypothetical protein
MKFLTHDHVEQVKARKWLAIIWLSTSLIYLLAALLDKDETDRNFHIATALIYFTAGTLSIFLVRRISKKFDKSKE